LNYQWIVEAQPSPIARLFISNRFWQSIHNHLKPSTLTHIDTLRFTQEKKSIPSPVADLNGVQKNMKNPSRSVDGLILGWLEHFHPQLIS
jgi:hypothetical protein